jgi:hypothetical protein
MRESDVYRSINIFRVDHIKIDKHTHAHTHSPYLKNDARRLEGDLHLLLRRLFPVHDVLDVLSGHFESVTVAQSRLQQHLHTHS